MKTTSLIYEKGSETLRQMPQNYLIANFENNRWYCEPDLACDPDLASHVFLELLRHENKWCRDGEAVLRRIGQPTIRPERDREMIRQVRWISIMLTAIALLIWAKYMLG